MLPFAVRSGRARGGQYVNTTFGRYRLLDRLGQGGMAEVFKAKSYGVEGFEKVVVIKRILPELAQSDAVSYTHLRAHET